MIAGAPSAVERIQFTTSFWPISICDAERVEGGRSGVAVV